MTASEREAALQREALIEKSWYEDAHGEVVLLSDATDALETLAAHPTPPPPLDALRKAMRTRAGYKAWKANPEPPCLECGGGKGLGHTPDCPVAGDRLPDADKVERLTQALRVATHEPHDQLGESVEGFPVCSVCGAIQTDPPCTQCGGGAGLGHTPDCPSVAGDRSDMGDALRATPSPDAGHDEDCHNRTHIRLDDALDEIERLTAAPSPDAGEPLRELVRAAAVLLKAKSGPYNYASDEQRQAINEASRVWARGVRAALLDEAPAGGRETDGTGAD